MDTEPKTKILTVIYTEEGIEPCLVVAENTKDGKKEILNIVQGMNASGIFKLLTCFQRVLYGRGNGKTLRTLDMLAALDKLKDL